MEFFFDVCSISGRNAREGIPGSTLAIESSHGRENGITPFTSMGVGKRSNCNRFCEVLYVNDLWSSATHPPAGTGAGMGSVTGNRFGRLNFMPL